MTIEGLVSRIREEFLADAVGAETGITFWSTADIVASLNQAERELCRRLYLLSDSTTQDVCQIAIVEEDVGVYARTYLLDNRILKIDRLKWPNVSKPLTQTTTTYLDQFDEGWEDFTGTPTHFVVDSDAFTIIFNRRPIAAATVNMTVKRLPLTPLNEKDATEESPELKQLDDEMIHGALKYLFIKVDVESFNVDLAKKWDNQFETDITFLRQNRAAMNPYVPICKPERF